jgi:hemolysin D
MSDIPVTPQKPAEPQAKAAPPQQAPRKPSRADQEFLPAALEILETPPSPVRIALLVLICAFVVISLIWAYFGTIDVIASAQGKIQPPGRVKVIQPLEAGKVARIGAINGARVKEGDALVELDATELTSDAAALRLALASAEAEILRREAAVNQGRRIGNEGINAALIAGAPRVEIAWPEAVSGLVRQREEGVLRADLAQLIAQLAALDAQARQKQAEKARLTDVIGAQGVLVATLKERVEMRDLLSSSGSGSRASLIDARETLQTQQASLISQIAQSREADAAIEVLARERERAIQVFITENTQKRSEALRLVEELTQRRAKAEYRLNNLVLRAPSDGTVQASTLYTIGQVVTVGQEVMRIVPQGDVLEVEAYLPNKDIGFIIKGAEVTVKVDSFPYTRYGTVSGKVSEIARDAIPHSDIGQIEGDPTRASEQRSFAGAQRIQNLVFPVTVSLDKTAISIGARETPLVAGMTVTIEIKTGRRRILEYLFSPLLETTSEAMRER